MSIINMQTMRYINLLDLASRVKTRKCFIYNNTIIFAVPKHLVSKAIGPNAINIKKLQEKLGRKVRIVKEPEGLPNAEEFISSVVSPIKFKSVEVKDKELVISAGNTQNKAGLIGRNKVRLEELKVIINAIFNLDLRIA